MFDNESDRLEPPRTVKNPRVMRGGEVPPDDQQPYTVRASAPPVYSANAYPAPPPPPLSARESAARERLKKRKVNGRGMQGGEWAWVVIAVALLGVVVTMSLTFAVVLRASQSGPDVMPTAEFPVVALPTAVDLGAGTSVVPGLNALTLNDGRRVALVPWDGTGRLTILAMGLDRRPGETGLGYRTDTMLLLSLDPRTNEIGMLSIPRDLYVDVPGYSGLRRINEPMVLGELQQRDYGPVLAMETVQYNLGIRVNHFVAVDFTAFIEIINALGGIEVDNPTVINDQTYPDMDYGYDPFYLAAGRQVLDGPMALKYARTRHGDSDIERGRRQQQVLFAILEKASRAENLPALLVQVPTIWSSLQNNLYTDISLESLIQLGLYVKDIPRENIKTGSISYEYLMDYTTPQGAQVLVPNRTRLGELMATVFGRSYSE